ncbi:MAG: rod shape-determining protein RodA, partial [Acidimicrobiales bacterium]
RSRRPSLPAPPQRRGRRQVRRRGGREMTAFLTRRDRRSAYVAPEVNRALRRNPLAPRRHVDYSLAVAAILTALAGAAVVFTASQSKTTGVNTHFVTRQLLFLLLGGVAMGCLAALDYRLLRRLAPLVYVGSLGLLGGVFLVGERHNGAQAWYNLSAFQLQPSEPAKVAIIVVLAAWLAARPEVSFGRLVVALGVAAAPMALILGQPDLGTMLVFAAIALGMLVAAGAPTRHLLMLLLAGAIGVVLILRSDVLAEFQRDRLTQFISANTDERGAGWNVSQSLIAVGSGGLSGKGFGQGPQTQNGYVPEQQTDFIFTAVGEELGFLGGALALTLLAFLCLRVLRSAALAADRFGTLLCAGVLSMLVFQIFQNVGMSLGIMPVTGIPLPLFSYGGSSTVTVFGALGVVQSVHMRRLLDPTSL